MNRSNARPLISIAVVALGCVLWPGLIPGTGQAPAQHSFRHEQGEDGCQAVPPQMLLFLLIPGFDPHALSVAGGIAAFYLLIDRAVPLHHLGIFANDIIIATLFGMMLFALLGQSSPGARIRAKKFGGEIA